MKANPSKPEVPAPDAASAVADLRLFRELRKLKAEVEQIQTPFRKTYQFWFGSCTAIFTALTVIFSGSSDQCVLCFVNAQDFEFVELAIPEAVGLSFHGLDLGVGSFQRAG